MLGQLRTMQEQITEMSVQSGILQESVSVARDAATAAQKSAEAAKISADIAAWVSVPTLVMEKFENGETGAASLEAFLQYAKVRIAVKNCGQTPAFLKWWTIVFMALGTCRKSLYTTATPVVAFFSKRPSSSNMLPIRFQSFSFRVDSSN
jgi:hypothetical protein